MPEARKSSTDQDITQESVPQLAKLMTKTLWLHLASRHLLTTGAKATMAQRLYNAIHAPNAAVQQHSAIHAPTQLHSVDSSVSQPQQDATLTLSQQSDGPVSSQQQGKQQQQGMQQQQSTQQQQGTQQQQHTQQLHEANPAVTSLLQQHTNVMPAIASTASQELARLFDQFIRQAIPSHTVPPTAQPPAPLSPASIDVTLPMVRPQTQLHPHVQQGQPQQGQPMMQPQQQGQTLMQPQQGQPLTQQQGQPLIQQPLLQPLPQQQQAPPQQQCTKY